MFSLVTIFTSWNLSFWSFSVIVYIAYLYLAHTRYRSLYPSSWYVFNPVTQRQMAELFDVDVRTISEHLGNVFSSGELERGATIRKFRIVRSEGSRQVTRSIDLDHLEQLHSRLAQAPHASKWTKSKWDTGFSMPVSHYLFSCDTSTTQ